MSINQNILSIVKPHIEAYNYFIDMIPEIIKSLPCFEYTLHNTKIRITSFNILKPSIADKDTADDRRTLPRECRLRGMTYKGRISLTLECVINECSVTIPLQLGSIPIMVKSNRCHNADNVTSGEDKFEAGGYFIVNGNEKVVRLLSSQKRNFVFAIKRTSNISKGRLFTENSVLARCVGPDEVGQTLNLHYLTSGSIVLRVYYRRRKFNIPVILILKMLINVSDEEIYKALIDNCDDNEASCTEKMDQMRVENLLHSFKELNLNSSEDCLNYVGVRFKAIFVEREYTSLEAGHEFIKRLVAIHAISNIDKYNFLIHAIRKLYRLVNNGRVDDPDSQSNHEIITVSQLFCSLLKECLFEIGPQLKKHLSKLKTLETDKIRDQIKSFDYKVVSRFESFLSTGNLTLTRSSDITESAGLTIIAEKINYFRFISHFRCVNRGNFFSQLKTTTVRKLRPETWGFYCPVHTPDGSPCGIITHLTQKTEVVCSGSVFDISVLFDLGMLPKIRGVSDLRNITEVMLDGVVMGVLCNSDCIRYVERLRKYRANNGLKFEVVYIRQDDNPMSLSHGIFIFNTPGRLTRAVMNSDNQIEYIGIMEQMFLHIKESKNIESTNAIDNLKCKESMNEQNNKPDDRQIKDADSISLNNLNDSSDFMQGNNTFASYYEKDDTAFLSVVAGLTPFSDFNQSPRNMYQCQMAKQTMGTAFHNIKNRVENKSFKITYPQAPIVRTKTYVDYEMDEYPMGINAIVAVLAYTAYDMEDAMVINKSSYDRGFFHGSVYKNELIKLDRGDKFFETPEVGTWLGSGDIFYRVKKPSSEIKNVFYKGFEGGYVDEVRIFNSNSSLIIVSMRVTIRIPRNPSIGDKFCSRHGQKGVCSMLWPTVDMPFTEDGLVPDIIINPHAFPSRMTIGMLVESMAGKSGTLMGKKQDGTPFQFGGKRNRAVDYFGEELLKHGYNYHGNQIMYSGSMGTQLEVEVFIGVVYYQRLRHMVNDKFQVRSSGAVNAITKQPIGGRKNKGGVRLGEMERDALIAHGCSYILNDRLMAGSDNYLFSYCPDCKSIIFTGKRDCICGGKIFKEIELPFVFKYLCTELMAMNIRVKIEIE